MRIQCFATTGCLLLVSFCLWLVEPGFPMNHSGTSQALGIEGRRVNSFRVERVSVIDALLQLGRQEQIPMGIEYIDLQALEEPISVTTGPSTVAEVLNAILSKASGYSWSVRDGVVAISHASIGRNHRNLLNWRLSHFSVTKMTLADASHLLEMTLAHELQPDVKGWVGSYSPGNSRKTVGPLDLHDVSVRKALNRLVAQAGSAAWIVQVPPGGLGQLPSYGLWRIVEYETTAGPYAPFLLQILRSPKTRATP